jgi:hypothetical protein
VKVVFIAGIVVTLMSHELLRERRRVQFHLVDLGGLLVSQNLGAAQVVRPLASE